MVVTCGVICILFQMIPLLVIKCLVWVWWLQFREVIISVDGLYIQVSVCMCGWDFGLWTYIFGCRLVFFRKLIMLWGSIVSNSSLILFEYGQDFCILSKYVSLYMNILVAVLILGWKNKFIWHGLCITNTEWSLLFWSYCFLSFNMGFIW